jgi:Ni/Co efflux regulator RcnB
MRKLLLSTVTLAALMVAPLAMADPNDNPKQQDTNRPDRGGNDRDNPNRGNGPDNGGPNGGSMQGPNGSMQGPNNTMGGPNGGNAGQDRDRMNERGSNNTTIRENNRTVIHDNDRTVNKTVVRKNVDRGVVLKFRANIRAPHRFRAPRPYVRPAGWYPHRWRFGERLPRAFFVPDYFILDFAAFGLFAPWPGYQWVRYGNDALLIDIDSGEVIRVEYDVFY